MRKTASYRVTGLSRYCTDPEEAEKKMRKAIGWGIQLQRRIVRKIKLEDHCFHANFWFLSLCSYFDQQELWSETIHSWLTAE